MAKKSQTQKKVPRSKVLGSGKLRNWKIILPVAIMVLFGGYGVWSTYFTSATTALSSTECYLRGRTYNSSTGDCSKTCLSGAGTITYGKYFDWCSKAISTSVSSSTCDSKGRKYVASTGCARRWQQTQATGVAQCKDSSATYYIASVDYCKGSSSSSTTTSSSWGWPVSPNSGITNGYKSGHYAQDFAATSGTKVLAVADGTIVAKPYISYSCGYGLIMKVKLSDGSYVYPTYEHIRYSSASGTVSKGTVIGYVTAPPSGKSDCWTGYHLHLGVQKQGSYIESHRTDSSAHPNPCTWISGC